MKKSIQKNYDLAAIKWIESVQLFSELPLN